MVLVAVGRHSVSPGRGSPFQSLGRTVPASASLRVLQSTHKMSSRTFRLTSSIVVLLVALVAAYWYWSPILAMRSMRAAAQAKDADAFNQYVDYPKLRESLKGQFAAQLAGGLGNKQGGSEMEKAGTALGTMLGLALVDRMIDALVRPEMIMSSMNEAKLKLPEAGESQEPPVNAPNEVRWSIERKGVNRVLALGEDAKQPRQTPSQQFAFVFDREGFATWKLSEIRLPADQ